MFVGDSTLKFVRHLLQNRFGVGLPWLMSQFFHFCMRIEDVSRETGGEGVPAPLPLRVLTGVDPFLASGKFFPLQGTLVVCVRRV